MLKRVRSAKWLYLAASATFTAVGLLLAEANPPEILTGSAAFVSSTVVKAGSFRKVTVDSLPKLSSTSFSKLSDVAPSDFWSPFYP